MLAGVAGFEPGPVVWDVRVRHRNAGVVNVCGRRVLVRCGAVVVFGVVVVEVGVDMLHRRQP